MEEYVDCIHLFDTVAEFNTAYTGSSYAEPWVSFTMENSAVSFNFTMPAVDLGLPSGLLWAGCNLGAKTPEGYGDFYAWGEIEPNKATAYTWNNYRFGPDTALTKYNTTDGKTILDPEDDAAHVVLGGNWRMPTIGECRELMQNCTSAWTRINGIQGVLFTSTANTNTIFFPEAGYMDTNGRMGLNTYFDIWCSNRSETNAYSYYMYGAEGRIYDGSNGDRYLGFSIRGVINK